MDNWIEYAPACGWVAFERSIAVTEALHSRLPSEDWHCQWQYLNFVEIREPGIRFETKAPWYQYQPIRR